jgi:outer membrane protein W
MTLSRAALLALLLATALPVAAVPPAGQVSLFVSGLDPESRPVAISPGIDLALRTGGGVGGTFTLLWTDRRATSISLGAIRLPLELSGSEARSSNGGRIDFVPLTVLQQVRFHPRGRTQGYAGLGLTYPFVTTSLSSALREAGVDRIRRPDHPALALGVGLDITVSPRTTIELDLRGTPYAETLVVIPRGTVFKSQRLESNFHPVTLSVGLAWRPF